SSSTVPPSSIFYTFSLHDALPIFAGTNGKGSTSHLLASILASAGYKTGLYTSPHLVDFRERIRINGAMIPKENVIDFVNQHRSLDRKSTRLNSSHVKISYAVFCLK